MSARSPATPTMVIKSSSEMTYCIIAKKLRVVSKEILCVTKSNFSDIINRKISSIIADNYEMLIIVSIFVTISSGIEMLCDLALSKTY